MEIRIDGSRHRQTKGHNMVRRPMRRFLRHKPGRGQSAWPILRASSGIVLLWFACALGLERASDASPRVQVRGSSRLEIHATGPASRITIRGFVRDEVGTPIARAPVLFVPFATPEVSIPWTSITLCDRPPPSDYADHDEHLAEADDAGAFCLVASLPRTHATLRAKFGGDALHEGTQTEMQWDASQRSTSLAFVARPDRIDLDAPRLHASAKVTVPPDMTSSGHALNLYDERGQELANSTTNSEGLAQFDVPTTRLDGPGIGGLRASFAGSATLAFDETTATVTRYARVRLEVNTHKIEGEPSRGLDIQVHATTSRGPVVSGTVQALFGASVVGTGAVRDGVSSLTVLVVPPRGMETLPIEFRYVPDAPFYEPGAPVQLAIRVKRSSAVLRFVPVVALLGVAAWLLQGWRRPKRREPLARGEQNWPVGNATIEVLRPSSDPLRWSGKVVDAHDGTPIAHATVRVIAPSFVDLDVVVTASTDVGGAFAFTLTSSRGDLRLRTESSMHAELERVLPPPSDMLISLISRRRMLLQRLVDWARRAGRPWDAAPESTPGHLYRVARRQRRNDDVAVWAETLERKAYGPELVDARAEREVQALEPGWQPPR